MSDHYNTNNVPHSIPGGTVQLYNGVGTAKSVYIFENFTPVRPKVVIERSNEVKGEGDWVDAGRNFNTATVVLQIPKSLDGDGNSMWPNYDDTTNGDWYCLMDSKFGGTEKWVFLQCTQTFEFGAYWKASYELKKDPRYTS